MIEYIDVGATYFFNKNMSTYVDYKINLIDESDFTRAVHICTDNIVATGHYLSVLTSSPDQPFSGLVFDLSAAV